MGKLVIPKHSSDKDDFIAALKIYYEKNNWVENEDFIDELKKVIGDGQYRSSYNKKAQLPKYFGFITVENTGGRSPRQKISSLGKLLYEEILGDNQKGINESFMISMENIEFGRNNFGCTSSDSNIEMPNVTMHAIKDLEYVTYIEIAFILQNLDDDSLSYDDCIKKIKESRLHGGIEFSDENKYADNKSIMLLVNFNVLRIDETLSQGRAKAITFHPLFKEKYFSDIDDLKIYNLKKPYFVFENDDAEDKDETKDIVEDFDFAERLTTGENTLLYGVPGAGKSYTIETEYVKNNSSMERLVFHPDYTYSDFVGQILPVVKEDADGNKNVSYEFTPGPFTTILKDAYTNPMIEHFLVIEEVNRGNAPSIFGDIFQLLDRKSTENGNKYPIGTSQYEISNSDIAKYVYGNPRHKVRIPSNLSIIGTMNTSDQNVFTLDTAFQRRWNMRLIENRFTSDDTVLANTKILDTNVSWKKFCTYINDIILEKNVRMTSSEDKRLGTHFINISDLQPNGEDEKHSRLFPEKVIKYLWDDAFKFTREEIFDLASNNSLERVIRKFIDSTGDDKFSIFIPSVKNELVGTDVESAGETTGE